jgi:t-SNARE complex subunit (syntaxin)
LQEEVDRQAPIVADIDQQLHTATAHVRSNNLKLRGVVTQLRGRRSFCLDVTLAFVLLAIIAAIVTTLQKH